MYVHLPLLSSPFFLFYFCFVFTVLGKCVGEIHSQLRVLLLSEVSRNVSDSPVGIYIIIYLYIHIASFGKTSTVNLLQLWESVGLNNNNSVG